jgi:hypothetical protein
VKYNSLTEFEIQILIYLSHVVVRDLVNAKIYEKIYEGLLNPDELIDLIKKLKSDLANQIYLQSGLTKTPVPVESASNLGINNLNNPDQIFVGEQNENGINNIINNDNDNNNN